MKKFLAFAAAAVAASTVSFSAHAGIVDFVAEAAGNERGINSGDTLTIDGVSITFNSNFSPYFDDLSGGLPGGLGVCGELEAGAGSECADSGDDSIDGDDGMNEYIELVFNDGPFLLRQLSFTDGAHMDLNDNNADLVGIIVNGVDLGAFTFAAAVVSAAAGSFGAVDSIRFTFVGDSEFYLNSIGDVPIPGAIPLLLSGLAGLGFASRRKSA